MRVSSRLTRGAVTLLTVLALACAEAVAPIAVSEIVIVGAQPTLVIGQTLQLQATPRSATGEPLTDRQVTWETSNGAVASVTPSGFVTAIATGTVQITARSEQASNSVTFTVNAQLTITASGTGNGTVTSNPPGINCTVAAASVTGNCQGAFAGNTVVTLTAAASGSGENVFAGWSGTCFGTTATCQVTMGGNRSESVTFHALFTVTVTSAGSGNGTVVSVPPGINCTVTGGIAGGTCQAAFTANTQATLTATPMQGSFVFAGWSGACTGTSTTCPLATSANRSVTATFNGPPIVATLGTDNITPIGARAIGSVRQDGNPYTVWFEFGPDPLLASFNTSPAATGPTTNCAGPVVCNWVLTMPTLTPGTTYYFRVAAQNSLGTTKGSNLRFTAGTQLQNNVAVTGISGTQGTWQYFRIVLPTGVAAFTVSINGGTGDADLYVRRFNAPTLINYLCRPFFDGNNESCTIQNPTADEWIIALHSYSVYSGVTLLLRY